MRYAVGDTLAQTIEIHQKVSLDEEHRADTGNIIDHWRNQWSIICDNWNMERFVTMVTFGAFYGGGPGFLAYYVIYPRVFGTWVYTNLAKWNIMTTQYCTILQSLRMLSWLKREPWHEAHRYMPWLLAMTCFLFRQQCFVSYNSGPDATLPACLFPYVLHNAWDLTASTDSPRWTHRFESSTFSNSAFKFCSVSEICCDNCGISHA